MWQVEVTDEFIEWWHGLSADQQESLTDRVDLLAERGPDLGRPVVDRVRSSRHHNMKELRAAEGGALRVLFMFDPRRQVILLLGGDKSGKWNEWYEWAVPLADEPYDEYLEELKREELTDGENEVFGASQGSRGATRREEEAGRQASRDTRRDPPL